MEKITEIREKLDGTDKWEPWMEELESDGRKAVQKLLVSWKRKQALQEKLIENHDFKQQFDSSFKENPEWTVAGIDEAGRGPLAGPVVTAAVVLPDHCPTLLGLDDSKKIPKAKREYFADEIKKIAVSYSIHIQPPEEIDRLNIFQATKQSMAEAAMSLDPSPSIILADAMQLDIGIPCVSIIKGDAKSLAIAAASILAKTGRDAIMEAYAAVYPEYGFAKHAGYGTKAHVEAIQHHGPTPIHRRTFEPVKGILEKAAAANARD
ncbi:ribonuclease HII [Planomicrobium sp. Y74]|uniref:ribonuclease HII n=1 Tax=Planomicrobium sp. Y74 TaxID=2478977 RepID=UPI000EF472AC|nr:ribonuclease HII [Planomicrobium sp. Y74]RLQ93037.1 ribonuclease HII [Planomicrobium sp. Y74]